MTRKTSLQYFTIFRNLYVHLLLDFLHWNATILSACHLYVYKICMYGTTVEQNPHRGLGFTGIHINHQSVKWSAVFFRWDHEHHYVCLHVSVCLCLSACLPFWLSACLCWLWFARQLKWPVRHVSTITPCSPVHASWLLASRSLRPFRMGISGLRQLFPCKSMALQSARSD